MHGDPLPDPDHVLRYAAYGRLQRNEDDQPVALLPQALQLKPDEEYLSVTWVEYFEGEAAERITFAVQAFRKSYQAGTKSAFGLAEVGRIKQACLSLSAPAKVRILHEPEDDNPGHSAIRRIPRDNQDLLELLTTEVFVEVIRNSSVPVAGG